MKMPRKNSAKGTNRKTERKGPTGSEAGPEGRNVYSLWTDGYGAISKLWQESYVDLYNPWIESAGRLIDKAAELSKGASTDKYREFFNELMETHKNTLGKIYPIPKTVASKETLEKLVAGAKESATRMKSWSDELESNSKKTQEMLLSGAGAENYRDFYEMWAQSYDKIFDESLEMMTSENVKGFLEGYVGMPEVYMTSIAESMRMWKDATKNLFTPWLESSFKLYEKFVELSKGSQTPEKYREFYDQWIDTYRGTYSKMFATELAKPSKEMTENMLKSVNTSMEMYRSWLTTLEKMSERLKDLFGGKADPETFNEFYALWIETYEKAFEDFFTYMPALEPVKDIFEPMKKAARMQAEIYGNMSRVWMENLGGKSRTA